MTRTGENEFFGCISWSEIDLVVRIMEYTREDIAPPENYRAVFGGASDKPIFLNLLLTILYVDIWDSENPIGWLNVPEAVRLFYLRASDANGRFFNARAGRISHPATQKWDINVDPHEAGSFVTGHEPARINV